MKKRFALFTTGWQSEILCSYTKGVLRGLQDESADLYAFMGFPSYADENLKQDGELNIFELPDLSTFDGALILGNLLDFEGVCDQLIQRCRAAEIPVVMTGRKSDYAYHVDANNYEGAYDLASHLILTHHVTKPYFISGNKENKDANLRLQALKDVMKDQGLKFDPNAVFYSKWQQEATLLHIRKMLSQSGAKHPDAFICANDLLAMIACRAIEECGYRVPEDIIVTGFDYDYFAQVHSPSIASVDQRFARIGEESIETLLDVLSGEERPREQTIFSTFYPSESCGCVTARDYDKMRRELGRGILREHTDATVFGLNLRAFEDALNSVESFREMRENISRFYMNERFYIGNSFHIVLEHAFEKSLEHPELNYKTKGYSRKMNVIFSMDKGHIITDPDFDSVRIVPQTGEEYGNRFYVLTPLNEHEKSFGYLVFCDFTKQLERAEQILEYTKRITMLFGKLRHRLGLMLMNRRLIELTETDSLTRVKNRIAYEAREEELNEQIRKGSAPPFSIALFDLNNLKYLNDALGHSEGDEYIIRCCSLLCQTFKLSPIYRIGGDEFVALLMGHDYENRGRLMEELKQMMFDQLEKHTSIGEIMLFAGGCADYNPKTDQCVKDIFDRADYYMYQNKNRLKELESIKNGAEK